MDTEQKNWGAEPWRQPKIEEGDALIFSEHGRVLDNTCYRSHWFCVVKAQHGGYFLLVKHGGGEERFQIGWSNRIASALVPLDSDSRYLLLYTLYHAHSTAKREARENTSATYNKAFVDGRLKKRKFPARGITKVWIEPAQDQQQAA